MIDLSKRCHYTCVEALNNFRRHFKSISYIKSVWAPSDIVDRHNDAHMQGWSETRASLSTYTISTVVGCIIFDIFVEQLCYPRYISPTHPKHCELLLRDIAYIMWERSVGSRWWSVCLHGHYHHSSVHQMHDGSMVDGGLVLG